MLREGERDQRHQGVVVQPGPGPPLEVVEAEFFLQLLVRLLAGPPGLDRRREGLQRRAGGMAGEVVLPLAASFAARRVRVADGPQSQTGHRLPGDELWLVGERRSGGERKYHLASHPAGTPLQTLAAAVKARWACEQAHQQLK